jgi:hypothetical protein
VTDSEMLMEALENRATRREERRAFFKAAVGAAAVGAGAFLVSSPAQAQTVTDADVVNFALNLEYLEANFYYYAAFGAPIPTGSIGTGGAPAVPTPVAATATAPAYTANLGARAVNFQDRAIRAFAREIAADELAHVNFLRTTLGSAAVAQPLIDVGIDARGAFSSAARAAGFLPALTATATPTAADQFDPYASDLNFLYGAYIFEDVGVTAYKGASPLITNKDYLEAAAGILAAEAYHAGLIRTSIDRIGVQRGLLPPRANGSLPTIRDDTEAVSTARDSLDGTTDLDQGIGLITNGAGTVSNIVPTDGNGIAFSRTTGQVLNIVYLNRAAVTAGGFFPNGVNGTIRSSTNNVPAA